MSERIGMLLVLLGIILIAGFSLFSILDEPDVPITLVVGIVMVVAGLAVLLVAVIRERLKDRADEHLEGIKP